MAEVVYPYPRQHWHGRIAFFEVDLDHRIGIPLSQLDGRNGGNAAWRSLSERSAEHTSEIQSLMRSTSAVFGSNKNIQNSTSTLRAHNLLQLPQNNQTLQITIEIPSH